MLFRSDLPVEVRAGRVPGVAEVADDVALVDHLPRLDRVARQQVAVAAVDPVRVGEEDDEGGVRFVRVPADERDDPVRRGADPGG